uniref:Uncharacterized protein n=1 Tax=Sphaerodactylus townsendi TaxID=933632 RepID=A0ACB8FS24_9SAUR
MAAMPLPGPARIPRWISAHHSLEKALQGLAKLQQLARQPRLRLRNSPPYLPHILSQTHQHLRLVREQSWASGAKLWEEGGYFLVYLSNLLEKIKQATRLFKRDKEEIFQEGSPSRGVFYLTPGESCTCWISAWQEKPTIQFTVQSTGTDFTGFEQET